MSADQTEAADSCCASCGIAELDDIKLKTCDACDLVKYCSDECQQEHRPQHEAMCKERAVELRDEKLFKQPESSHLGDCPICLLPLPINMRECSMMSCCSKLICRGCSDANYLRQLEERQGRVCPFCRHPTPKTQEEGNKNKMKRVEKKDPVAIREIGKKHYHKGDYDTAFEHLTNAAELGDVDALYQLSNLYRKGHGAEKDEKKRLYHLEEAAIAGHPDARYNLACHETRIKRFDRAVKHFIIAANLGDDESIQQLKKCYKYGDVSKDDFAAALVHTRLR